MSDNNITSQVDPVLPPSKPENEKATPFDPSEHKGLSRLPSDVKSSVTKVDEFVLRLARTIKTTAGFTACSSTLCYSLYIAAYAHQNAPSRAYIIARISQLLGRDIKIPTSALAAPAVSPLVSLAAMMTDFRATLRLTGLLSLYALLKTLLSQQTRQNMDPLKHKILVTQALAYIGFQAMENITVLTTKGVLAPTIMARGGGPTLWVRWACRSWLVGVSTDFVRLWRDAALMRERKAKGESISVQEQDEFDRKWWTDLQVCTAWLPMALHYSLDGGLTGMNQGLIGLSGFLAGIHNTRAAWKAAA